VANVGLLRRSRRGNAPPPERKGATEPTRKSDGTRVAYSWRRDPTTMPALEMVAEWLASARRRPRARPRLDSPRLPTRAKVKELLPCG